MILFRDILFVLAMVKCEWFVSGSPFTQRIVANEEAQQGKFGHSVALDRDTLVVGTKAGESAYVFVRSGTTWTQQQKLFSGNGGKFGFSVALDGDTAVIGAESEYVGWGTNPGGLETANPQVGSAYVFVRSGTMWTQQQKLAPNDVLSSYAFFGRSVALDGDTLVVGTHHHESAYVFVRSGTMWMQQQKLATNDARIKYFGASIALDGDTLVVGAFGDNHYEFNDWGSIGSVYVFVRSGNTWTQQQKLVVSDARYEYFGWSVALDGDTVVIGAKMDDKHDDSGEDEISSRGSAYVFVRSGTTWTQQQKLVPNDVAMSDEFGCSVALDGDTAVIGASEDHGVYVFVRSGTTWSQQQNLFSENGSPPFTSSSHFFLALENNTAVVGAGNENGVYVYENLTSSSISALNGLLGLISASMFAFVLV